MPTIKISIETYEALQSLMADELRKKLNKNKDFFALVKNNCGVTYNYMVDKLIDVYKKSNKVTK